MTRTLGYFIIGGMAHYWGCVLREDRWFCFDDYWYFWGDLFRY